MDMHSDNQFHTGLPVTPRITVAHGSINASSVERRASLAAFLCCAWERSNPICRIDRLNSQSGAALR